MKQSNFHINSERTSRFERRVAENLRNEEHIAGLRRACLSLESDKWIAKVRESNFTPYCVAYLSSLHWNTTRAYFDDCGELYNEKEDILHIYIGGSLGAKFFTLFNPGDPNLLSDYSFSPSSSSSDLNLG